MFSKCSVAGKQGKARLGTVVHQKNAAALALTAVKGEDQRELAKIVESAKTSFNEGPRMTWGGGIMGPKSQAKVRSTPCSPCTCVASLLLHRCCLILQLYTMDQGFYKDLSDDYTCMGMQLSDKFLMRSILYRMCTDGSKDSAQHMVAVLSRLSHMYLSM